MFSFKFIPSVRYIASVYTIVPIIDGTVFLSPTEMIPITSTSRLPINRILDIGMLNK